MNLCQRSLNYLQCLSIEDITKVTPLGQIDSLNYCVCWNWLEFMKTAIYQVQLDKLCFYFIIFSFYLQGGSTPKWLNKTGPTRCSWYAEYLNIGAKTRTLNIWGVGWLENVNHYREKIDTGNHWPLITFRKSPEIYSVFRCYWAASKSYK